MEKEVKSLLDEPHNLGFMLRTSTRTGCKIIPVQTKRGSEISSSLYEMIVELILETDI